MKRCSLFFNLIFLCFYAFADFGEGSYYLKGRVFYDGVVMKNDSFVISNSFSYIKVFTNDSGYYSAKIPFIYPCMTSVIKASNPIEKELKLAMMYNAPVLNIYKLSSNYDTTNFWRTFYNSRNIPKLIEGDTQILDIYFKSNVSVKNESSKITDEHLLKLNSIISLKDREIYLYLNAKDFNFNGFSFEMIKSMLSPEVYHDSNKFYCVHNDNCFYVTSAMEGDIEKQLAIVFRFQNGYVKDWKVSKQWKYFLEKTPFYQSETIRDFQYK